MESEIAKYLQELHKSYSFWEKLWVTPINKEDVLQKIGDIGDYKIIPDICDYLLHDNTNISLAAAKAINKIMLNATQDDLIKIDEQIRIRMTTAIYGIWYDLTPSGINRLIILPDNVSLIGLAASHWNGYVREAAMIELAKNHDGSELPYLLLRVNDWVKEVRELAVKTINARIIIGYAGHFIKNLMIVDRLLKNTRNNNTELVSRIHDLILKIDSRAELYNGLLSLDKINRRICYRLYFTVPDDNAVKIFKQAVIDADSIIRLLAIQNAASLLNKDDLREVLEKMLLDSYQAIRKKALQILVDNFPDTAHQDLLSALLNTSISIRELGQYNMRKLFPMDFAEFYRNALNTENGDRLLAAIYGLGETGIAADAVSLLPFAKQGLISHRKATINSISRLDGDNNIDLFVDALFQDHFGLSKEGREGLKNRIYKTDIALLDKTYHTTQYPHIKRNILLLFTRLGRWSRLPYFIMASNDENNMVQKTGKRYLTRFIYCEQHYIVPTAKEIEKIQNAIIKYRDGLSDKEYEDLLFMLKGASAR